LEACPWKPSLSLKEKGCGLKTPVYVFAFFIPICLVSFILVIATAVSSSLCHQKRTKPLVSGVPCKSQEEKTLE
jgi:hypothetical protein